ncbi:MAG: hypothetical protein JSU94_14900 [Phycisphaerales bacterium]|nr:MAG: hypothetical protein JSU94_14900 [Phycisphaerales bacterium]
MQTQLKVLKADGSLEEYLHTKVIGVISNALGVADEADICVAEQLAEVVTYYLYRREYGRAVTSSEILSVVQAVLSSTGYEEAAIGLNKHHFERKLRRSRIEVVPIDIQELRDAEALAKREERSDMSRWDKSRIVEDLVANYDVPRQTARLIASMVEEKVFGLGVTVVPASLIKQLVLGDTAAVLRAQEQLQTT